MKAILCRPRFDEPTQYTFDFATELLKWCQQAGIEVTDLVEGEAVRKIVEQKLTPDIELFIHYDHGNEDALIGQDKEAIIDLKNYELLADREVYTLACLSAKKLGKEVWGKGGKYWGYVEVVSFTTDALDAFQQAFNCGFYYLFIEGDKENALKRAKETFDDLALMLVDVGKTFAAVCMRQNRDNLVYYNANKPEGEGCLLALLKLPRVIFRRRYS